MTLLFKILLFTLNGPQKKVKKRPKKITEKQNGK